MSARVFVGGNGSVGDGIIDAGRIRDPGCPDAYLVHAAQLGNGEAFGVLVERYHRQVYGIVYRMCGAAEAEDLTQDIFVRALQALRGFKYQGQASFRTWLYRIAVNASINELRRRKRRRAVIGPSLDEMIETDGGAVARSVPDESRRPEDVLERKEERDAVHAVRMPGMFMISEVEVLYGIGDRNR